MKKLILLAFTGIFMLAGCKGTDKTEYEFPFYNPNLPVEERVDNLLSLLTLEEKVGMMMNRSVAVERLGIPAYNWWAEATHGIMTDGITVFPQAIASAATFDDESQLRTFTIISDEARARYNTISRDGDIGPYQSQIPNLSFWAPNVNIFRDPRWGRGQETYGEDPFLMSNMGLNVVLGMQGNPGDKYVKTHACAKHYAVHSGPEPLRHEFNAVVSGRDLWETYLPAFKTLVVDGHVREVMCAYSAYEGVPCCTSERLLIDILRNRWNYDGIILSDCDAINDFYVPGRHDYSPDAATASSSAVLNGTNLECGRSYQSLIEAVSRGLIAEKDLDIALRNVIKGRIELGMFDPEDMNPYSTIPGSVIDSQEHRDHALRVAHEALVLLRNNNNVLPLSKDIKTVAVVGPNIDDPEVMRGNYSGSPTHITTILQGIQAKLPNANIISERGSQVENEYVQYPQAQNITTNGQKGFKSVYYASENWTGQPVNTSVAEKIDFRTEGGYGFGENVPSANFTAVYTGEMVANFTGTLCLSIRGDAYRVKVNGKTIDEYFPQIQSNRAPAAAPGAQMTEAQRRQMMQSFSRRRGYVIEMQVEEGKKYAFEFDYKSGTTGAVSSFMVDMYQREIATFTALQEKIKDADVIIYVGGISPTEEGEGHERATIELPAVQQRFLQAMRETGKPVVYINTSGSCVGFECVQDYYDALIQAWYPGQEGGIAVADVLFGDFNPSGKLPVTFYKNTAQLPEFTDYNMDNRTYRYFKGEPMYAFGFGMSYTNFEFGQAKLSKNSIKKGQSINITIPVTNAGEMDGAEVVQVYVKSLTNPDAPIKALKGYKRVEITAGKTAKVKITLKPESFAYYSADADDLAIFAGDYQILYGNSSNDADLKSLPLTVK